MAENYVGGRSLAVKMRLVLHNTFMDAKVGSDAFVLADVALDDHDFAFQALSIAIQDAERLAAV